MEGQEGASQSIDPAGQAEREKVDKPPRYQQIQRVLRFSQNWALFFKVEQTNAITAAFSEYTNLVFIRKLSWV